MKGSNAQLREIQINIRCSPNIHKKFLEIAGVYGMNQNNAFQMIVIDSHKEHVRDGYIPVKYDNGVMQDLGVRAAVKLTTMAKGKDMGFEDFTQ